jgi:outer membrane protein OmpA-like peptidoglycan-associated protein
MWFRRDDDGYYYDDDESASRRRRIMMAGAALVVVVGVGAVWQLRAGSNAGAPAAETGTTASENPTEARSSTTATTTTSPAGGTARTRSTATTSTTVKAQEQSATAATTTVAAAPASIAASGTTPTTIAGAPVSDLGYPTSPDGTPLPVVAIFDTETITITGQVPSEQAKIRLAMLAEVNSQFPDAEVVNNVVVNPAVPLSVGVRVIELNSARFPEASADILPPHAAELDRVVTVMNALPNVTVLVVGHADQRGNDTDNFAISDERARAVVNYLRFLGISPTRLSSRAAGSADLLTEGDDTTSLALNRRTEFIFYGLLVE